jgi:hypothetical protein
MTLNNVRRLTRGARTQSRPRRDCCEFPPRQRPVCPASMFFQCPSARCALARACLQPLWSPARSAARARHGSSSGLNGP